MLNLRKVIFFIVCLVIVYASVCFLHPCNADAKSDQHQREQQRARQEQQERQHQQQMAKQRAQQNQQKKQQQAQEKQSKEKVKEKKNIQVQKTVNKDSKNVKSNVKPATQVGQSVTGHPATIPVSWGKASSTKPYQCTDYVHKVRPDLSNIHGDAATWLAKAKESGLKTASGADAKPVPGAVVVMQSPDPKNKLMNTYGHVGVVKETGTDQKGRPYLVMESANYNTVNGVKPNSKQGTPPTEAKVYLADQNIKGYIYDK